MSSAGGPGDRSRPCRSCGVAVYDLLYPKTGKTAPIEARLSSNGNVVVNLKAGSYQILTGVALELARAFKGDDAVLHVNHFVACPQAAGWHRRSKKAPA